MLYLIVALLLLACSEKRVQELTATSTAEPVKPTEVAGALTEEEMEDLRQKCEEYYASLTVHDSVRIAYLDRLLADKGRKLTANNRQFLMQLRQQFANSDPKQPRLTIEQALFPIFRIPDQRLGIIGQPVPDMGWPMEYTDLSAEKALLSKWVDLEKGYLDSTRMLHFPEALNLLYPAGKPRFYLYTTKTTGQSRVQDLGHYQNECADYYHYTFDEQALQTGDEVLFASRLPLDLTYENNPAFDSWYRSKLMPDCADCPSSHDKAISFAKLTGTENLYFMYADAFPSNRELYTPLRALVAKGENGKWIELWYSDIDNFGCSCL
ncbi:hypothetical protein SAMN05421545_2962 [Pontibacter lucknowensis]|uniref:Uncharacterized protein n=1 Tax=Pontibacter lucknowensis TaxID=1077936 RepID=A0A1N6ZG23_9BACT|nr:hypothetical protein SAMN05421545_2962 [Pontibacter lucknowensis]